MKFAFLSLVLLFTLLDCHCFDRRIVVKNLVLEIPNNNSRIESIDHEKMARVVEETIKESTYFRYDASDKKGAILKFSLFPPDDKRHPRNLMVMISLGTSSVDEESRALADISIEEGGFTTAKSMQDAFDIALANLHLMQKGVKSGYDKYAKIITASLAGNDVVASDLVNAVSLLGEARDQRAEAIIVSLMQSTRDVLVGSACLGALAKLKNPESMPAIIDFVERKPPLIRRLGIIAAKNIASQLALEWLLVMAYGHDDELVRKEALDALAVVEAKRQL